jgi:D-beta-D-heptose 7-phosphate kinase/D-beta-D-heptose 1-phosphate adenosyltransferase
MRNSAAITQKIYDIDHLAHRVAAWRVTGKKVAFTNGVFDMLHEGHVFSLSEAAKEADYLVVAINSDASVKRLKGQDRPVHHQKARALVVASLLMVDAVVIFDEDTPLNIITRLMPDVLVKGGDYEPAQIAGAREVIANGGRVVINPLLEGISTTNIIREIKKMHA